MADRSSGPHHSPARLPDPVVRLIVALRWRHWLGAAQIAGRAGIAASTVHAVLVPLTDQPPHLDRATGEPLRCYEHPHAGL